MHNATVTVLARVSRVGIGRCRQDVWSESTKPHPPTSSDGAFTTHWSWQYNNLCIMHQHTYKDELHVGVVIRVISEKDRGMPFNLPICTCSPGDLGPNRNLNLIPTNSIFPAVRTVFYLSCDFPSRVLYVRSWPSVVFHAFPVKGWLQLS